MTRVTRLPGDHSQVGWLPPSSVPYHYSEKDSSPLTRGKLAARQRRVPQAGFIPAHAGKTRWLRARSPPKRAHSRSRGENVDWFRSYLLPVGSSPLTQGKRCPRQHPWRPTGLIPAHAGKTDGGIQTAVARKAHPRSRGENAGAGAGIAAMSGSSPLTRGKRRCRGGNRGHERLIPAHAGKTHARGAVRWCRRAHPRSRGENLVDSLYGVLRAGSSPLTRGKHAQEDRPQAHQRLIPAHAGKTARAVKRRDDARAHPRSRGENASFCGRRRLSRGSSPLTRGKRGRQAAIGPPPRLIPAHAGKTPMISPISRWRPAHPRSRGEN